MTKILYSLFLLCTLSFAQVIQFNPQDTIKAQDFNNNFHYIKNLLKLKNKNIIFSNLENNNLITKEILENEFSKLQALGINYPTISSTAFIRSQEINQLFNSIISSIDSLEIMEEVVQNNTKTIDLSSVNSNYPNSFEVVTQGTKGTASINGSSLIYIPQSNILGIDSVVIKALNGNIANRTVRINLNIDGEGLIMNGTFITYHDGSLATTCNAYKTVNNGKKKYIGSTGNGIYKIAIPSFGEQLVYCDMTSDTGGWTLIASGGSSCTNFIPRGTTSPVYNTHASYGTNCGFLPELAVRQLANNSSNLRLRIGPSASSYTQVNSTGIKPVQSLRNTTNWHTNNAHLEFSAGYQWVWSCASSATYWPNMFHACNYTNGVHWMEGHKHSNADATRPVVSSNWLK